MIAVVGEIILTSKLSEWIKLKGWEQKDFAQAIDEDESLVSMWLTGRRTPTDKQKKKLCLVTGLDIGDLFTFDRNIKINTGE